MSKLGTTALLLVVAISAADAQACGEVMYRMGGALRYHAFITRHPAQILLYNGTAAQQANSADSQRFHENLEKAGHKVTVVDGPDALAKALGESSYDVIITYAGDLPAIREQITHVTREPALIPVLQRGDQDAMRKQYPLALNEDANLNQFLKTIEQTMKSRGT
jgi:ABC-type amino acid transport substrate-binding protein